MKIEINAIPSSLNKFLGRKNCWDYRKEKALWKELIYIAVKSKKIDIVQSEKVRVTLTYFFKTKARHDPDNYCGKMILDGLVEAGAIADDSFNKINLLLKGKYDKDNPRTEIEVENE